MVMLTIDGRKVSVEDSATILEAAAQANIYIPTLCYRKTLNEVGACRICMVEIEGCGKLRAACNTIVEEGMVIHTNSPRVMDARRTNLQLILSQHDLSCPTCVRNGNCSLQRAARELNLLDEPFEKRLPPGRWDNSYPLIRNQQKCIQCLRCVNVCETVQGLGIWACRKRVQRGLDRIRRALDENFFHPPVQNCPAEQLYRLEGGEAYEWTDGGAP